MGTEGEFVDRPRHHRRREHAADVLVQADAEPLTLLPGPQRLLERLGNAHRVRVRVERRRIPVGFGEGFREWTLSLPRGLLQHFAHGLAVEVTELPGGQCLLQVQHLEQVELQITHVALVMPHRQRLRYRRTVGLWPTDVRGMVGLGWFCAKPVQVPRCPATHGTPFIVGTGPPETTVGAPL